MLKRFTRKLPKSDGIYYERELLESAAYWELTGTAIKVLNVFYLKRRLPSNQERRKLHLPSDYVKNNGEIAFTYNEAERYGITVEQTFLNAIKLLARVGFIKVAVRGCYPNVPTKFSISDEWKQFGTIKKRRKVIPLI